MRTASEELEAIALRLPAADRARLARRLIESLDEDADIEAAWAEEVAKRVARVEAGEVELIPAADVFAEARRRLGGRV